MSDAAVEGENTPPAPEESVAPVVGRTNDDEYPPPVHDAYEVPDFEVRNTLDSEKRAVFDQMLGAMDLGTLSARQRAFCDDRCLRRYLVARDWNVKKASELLKGTLGWRDEYQPEEIRPEDMEKEAEWGKLYRRGFDRLGRPVLHARPVGRTTDDWDLQTRYTVHNFESAIASMGDGVEQIVWLIDYTDFSITSAPPLSFARGVLTTMSNHYPERLGAIYALNPPFSFRMLWGAIKPILNNRTRSKIHFLTGDDAAKKAALHANFDPAMLEGDFLGECVSGYDHAVYWPRHVAHYEDRVAASHRRTASAAKSLGIEQAPPAEDGAAKEGAAASDDAEEKKGEDGKSEEQQDDGKSRTIDR